MKGKLIDLSFGMNRKQRITIEVDGDFRGMFDSLKDSVVTVDVKKFKARRSASANAYFHVLVHAIAEANGVGNEEVKRTLVCEYGALARESDGQIVGFKLPVAVDVTDIYPYVHLYDTQEENGKPFNRYLLYKHTSDMNTTEMARLIDGAIYEAKALGLATDTPEQLARYKEEWNRK
ncbi:hypothetical protein RFF05_06610 [Bengtsoniella intestinalis]|uniref:hypothetical protein n=1 Tax=Bengtsoniella intestinalis TaxID=3073143 RepID=UPI00391FBD4C